MYDYEKEMNKTLKEAGFNPELLTWRQKNIILQPIEAPEDFYHDGEITPRQAEKYWRLNLQMAGLTKNQISKAIKLNS